MSIYERVYDVGSCIINKIYNIPTLLAGTAQWLSAGLMMERSRVRVHVGAAGEFFLQYQPSVLILISVFVPPPCYRSST